ncbi:MAG: cytochrome c [Proteobacteria bacterium]|nr:cytochrome c [Pseudomonadota bacterium]
MSKSANDTPLYCAAISAGAFLLLLAGGAAAFAEQSNSAQSNDAITDAGEDAKVAIDAAKKAALKAIERARRAVKDAIDKARIVIPRAIDNTQHRTTEVLDKAQRSTEELFDKTEDATNDALGKVQEAIDQVPKATSDQKLKAGEQTYQAYCALCHGIGARPGMFAEALKMPAPDLTQIAKHNGGGFPKEKVERIIRDGGISGHGTMRLLAWESYFQEDMPPEAADRKIDELVSYLESQQAR